MGVPLKEWCVNIYRGILTGYNEAFIISGAKKDELIAADPKSAEIIRPILRGRDIKRYSYNFADLWVIATFPSRKYDIDDFPAVKKHLLSFGMERLEQTGKEHIVNGKKIKARKKTNNKWFETQDSISYLDDLNRQKIVWSEISDIPKFALDKDGKFYITNKVFLMTGNVNLQYLLTYFNSTVCEAYFSWIASTTGEGTIQWFKYKVESIPVPKCNRYLESEIENLIDNNGWTKNKKTINKIFYKLLNFTNDEVDFLQEYK